MEAKVTQIQVSKQMQHKQNAKRNTTFKEKKKIKPLTEETEATQPIPPKKSNL